MLNATNITQIGLENYKFEHVNSNTNPGGVGIFVLNSLNYRVHDIQVPNLVLRHFGTETIRYQEGQLQ